MQLRESLVVLKCKVLREHLTFGLYKTNHTMSPRQHVCIYFEKRIIARWKFPGR